jgi:hypothetical protein
MDVAEGPKLAASRQSGSGGGIGKADARGRPSSMPAYDPLRPLEDSGKRHEMPARLAMDEEIVRCWRTPKELLIRRR